MLIKFLEKVRKHLKTNEPEDIRRYLMSQRLQDAIECDPGIKNICKEALEELWQHIKKSNLRKDNRTFTDPIESKGRATYLAKFEEKRQLAKEAEEQRTQEERKWKHWKDQATPAKDIKINKSIPRLTRWKDAIFETTSGHPEKKRGYRSVYKVAVYKFKDNQTKIVWTVELSRHNPSREVWLSAIISCIRWCEEKNECHFCKKFEETTSVSGIKACDKCLEENAEYLMGNASGAAEAKLLGRIIVKKHRA